MGVVETIRADRWPRQGRHLGARVRVFFHYDTSQMFDGIVIRDDMERPYLGIIQLDNGRAVLATECKYSVTMRLDEATAAREGAREE